ncbi:ABC transporter ATP-binding protein [Cesiribacter sp. SM1]|uniref:ABC transporter ATP-binding protein n=1 Tax=Cesiribacter sp. SM1 TaxID=2861196 RepID=UPI001CD5A5DC|nr:ATP-binding cassette domain-containing protein [Cesiribacter sp. SM1]
MIEFRNIKKSFDGKEILLGVSGEFKTGKTNLIIGSSGTGKSVLLKIIVGLIEPDQGDILYHGRNFSKGDKDLRTEIRQDIGMLFQGGALFDSMTVEQNVMFPLNLKSGLSPKEKIDRVNWCLERVGLENANKKMPSEISGGMKKRVGIARAIVDDVKYLFVDEPNSGLDPQTSIVIDDLIAEITKELNITTVVVTHDMNSVMGIGDHIIYLYKGRKLWEGSKDQILSTDVPELNEFVFANKLAKSYKKSEDSAA